MYMVSSVMLAKIPGLGLRPILSRSKPSESMEIRGVQADQNRGQYAQRHGSCGWACCGWTVLCNSLAEHHALGCCGEEKQAIFDDGHHRQLPRLVKGPFK